MKIKFEEFQSLLNENPKNSLKALRELGSERCVVTEKLHGANFSVYINEEGVKFASRSQMLGPDANFFQFRRFFTDERIEFLKKNCFKNLTLRLIGELFGGHDAPGIKPVQREIRYDGDIQFRVFDVQVLDSEGDIVTRYPWLHIQSIASRFGLETVPEIAIGTLEEMYQLDVEVPSKLSSKGDITEGFCFRIDRGWDVPVIFKRRSKNFCETKGKIKSAGAKNELDPAVLPMLHAAKAFVTEQRVSNVNSHFGFSEIKNFPDLHRAVMEDLEKDLAADLGMEPHIWKLIKRDIGAMLPNLIRAELNK